jgi:C4-dicarboxylate transporter/malic acid transport protein
MTSQTSSDGFRRIVRNFAPAWFTAVMGTGGLAIASFHFAEVYPVLRTVGSGLHLFNLILCAVLLLPWTLRWLLYPAAALGTLRHPVMGQFYATLPIGLLLLSAGVLLYGQPTPLAATLWTLGALATIFFSFVAFWVQFHGEHITLDHVTPGLFMPPVGLVVIPLAGQLLLGQMQAGREWVLVLSVGALGAGLFLWLSLLALTVHRFLLGRPLPGALLPTVWINLAPIGVISADLVGLAQVLPLSGLRETFPVLALLLWGFGVWWFVMALALTLRYWRRGELPFALTWWAFTFPLAAFAAASHRLSTLFGLDTVWAVGFAAYVLLVLFWLAAFIGSVRGVVSGRLFTDPAPPAGGS